MNLPPQNSMLRYALLTAWAALAQSTCLQANGNPCPNCSNACSECGMGTYGLGPVPCDNCPAGTFSSSVRMWSAESCGTCAMGTTTLPTDSGQTACMDCASANKPLPTNADSIDGPVMQCLWACKTAFVMQSAPAIDNATLQMIYPDFGPVSNAYLQTLYHRDNDYCCSGAVDAGKKRIGCSRFSDGIIVDCPRPSNAEFFTESAGLKLNRCDDWRCAFGFFRVGTYCQNQPVCIGQTYNRTDDGTYAVLPSGSFTCSPCSKCIAGSELAVPCNRTHDTVCRLCNSTSYSIAGGTCGKTPLGFAPIHIYYAVKPIFQGRPDSFWPNILRSYTPCAPSAVNTRYLPMYVYTTVSAGGAIPAPVCDTECIPWTGTYGFYRSLVTAECVPCAYDPTQCQDTEYYNLALCGPVANAQCTSCPAQPAENALGWVNPRAWDPVYPCDVVCKDGFTKKDHACTDCPSIPNNTILTTGCNWACRKQFFLSNGDCIPCPPSPTCAVGTYLGYALDTDQCKTCSPCQSPPNTAFTTAGQDGPNTCRFVCMQGHFVVDATFDSLGNPMECTPCSDPACSAGATFLVPCTPTNNAYCTACDVCAPGFEPIHQCTIIDNTVCASCDTPPANTQWTTQCAWACADGYMQVNSTTCVKCKTLCAASERFVSVSGCGTCVQCPALPEGRAFNGDGNCGTTALTCATRTYPRNGKATASTDVVLCPWTCNAGYMQQPAVSLDTSVLFHRESDACCNPATVGAGQQLVGCTRSALGTVQPCPVVPNARWVLLGQPSLSRCADFECNAGYTGSTCVQNTTRGTTSSTVRPVTTSTIRPITTGTPPTSSPPNVFVSVVSVDLPATLTVVTTAIINQLATDVHTQTGCALQPQCRTTPLSYVNATGDTVNCPNGMCRRLLGAITIAFCVVSQAPLSTTTVALNLGGVTLQSTVLPNSELSPDTLSQLLSQPGALLAYVQPKTTTDAPPFPIATVAGALGGVVAGIVSVASITLLVRARLAKSSVTARMPPMANVRITLMRAKQI